MQLIRLLRIRFSLVLLGIALSGPVNGAICIGSASECPAPRPVENGSNSTPPADDNVTVPIDTKPLPRDEHNNEGAALHRNDLAVLRPDNYNTDRIALLVGNSNYASIPSLDNSLTDVSRLSVVLRSLGFVVYLLKDADQAHFETALRTFVGDAANKKIGLVYYAGHAIQSNGKNYLIPVDIDFRGRSKVRNLPDAKRAIISQAQAFDEIMDLVSTAVAVRVFLLDACRNDSFPSETRAISVSGGLAPVRTKFLNVFIGYSTGPNEVALDSDGRSGDSPFAAALIHELVEGDRNIESMYKSVISDVARSTHEMQVPWMTSSLQRRFFWTQVI